MGNSLRYLVRPLGRWRTELLVRFLGLSYFLDFIRSILPPLLRAGSLEPLFAGDKQSYPWSYICGSLLLFTGPRFLPLLIVLLANAAVVLQYEQNWEPLHYDELVLVMLFLIGVLALAHGSRGARAADALEGRSPEAAGAPQDARAALDGAVCSLARVMLVIALAFVTLHKLNRDFLGETSCFYTISGGVADLWRFIPALHGLASPWAVLAADGLAAVLFVLAPRLGVLLLFVAFPQWGVFGPVGSTMRIMVLALAFLRPEDLAPQALQAGPARRRLVALGAVSALVGTGFTLLAYRQPSNTPWLVCFCAYLSTVTFFVALAAQLVLRDLRAGRSLFAPLWRSGVGLPRSGLRRVVLLLAAALFLNEAAPYLGAKRNYTLKMWSNLRTDHERWNSLVVPEQLKVLDWMDRQVLTVERIALSPTPRPLGRLQGTVAPREVLRVLRERTGFDWFSLAYVHAGKERSFEGRRGSEAFEKLLRRLMRLEGQGATLRMSAARARMTEQHQLLRHDLFSAVELYRTLEQMRPWVDDLELVLRDAQGSHRFPKAFSGSELDAFLRARIPALGKVWLTGDAGQPQPCVH